MGREKTKGGGGGGGGGEGGGRGIKMEPQNEEEMMRGEEEEEELLEVVDLNEGVQPYLIQSSNNNPTTTPSHQQHSTRGGGGMGEPNRKRIRTATVLDGVDKKFLLEQYVTERQKTLTLQLQSRVAQLERELKDKETAEKEKERIHQETLGLAEGEHRLTVLQEVLRLMEAELNCSICNEVFIEPAVLSCGHTFCTYCINRALQSDFLCPICRTGYNFNTPPKNVEMRNFIQKLYQMMSDDVKNSREQVERERAAQPMPDPTSRREWRDRDRDSGWADDRRGRERERHRWPRTGRRRSLRPYDVLFMEDDDDPFARRTSPRRIFSPTSPDIHSILSPNYVSDSPASRHNMFDDDSWERASGAGRSPGIRTWTWSSDSSMGSFDRDIGDPVSSDPDFESSIRQGRRGMLDNSPERSRAGNPSGGVAAMRRADSGSPILRRQGRRQRSQNPSANDNMSNNQPSGLPSSSFRGRSSSGRRGRGRTNNRRGTSSTEVNLRRWGPARHNNPTRPPTTASSAAANAMGIISRRNPRRSPSPTREHSTSSVFPRLSPIRYLGRPDVGRLNLERAGTGSSARTRTTPAAPSSSNRRGVIGLPTRSWAVTSPSSFLDWFTRREAPAGSATAAGSGDTNNSSGLDVVPASSASSAQHDHSYLSSSQANPSVVFEHRLQQILQREVNNETSATTASELASGQGVSPLSVPPHCPRFIHLECRDRDAAGIVEIRRSPRVVIERLPRRGSSDDPVIRATNQNQISSSIPVVGAGSSQERNSGDSQENQSSETSSIPSSTGATRGSSNTVLGNNDETMDITSERLNVIRRFVRGLGDGSADEFARNNHADPRHRHSRSAPHRPSRSSHSNSQSRRRSGRNSMEFDLDSAIEDI